MRFEGGLFAFSQVQSQQEGLIFLNYYNFDPFRITFPNYSHEFLCRSSYLNSRSAWCYQREHTGVSINLFSTVNRKVCSFVFTCKALLQDTKKHFLYSNTMIIHKITKIISRTFYSTRWKDIGKLAFTWTLRPKEEVLFPLLWYSFALLFNQGEN